MGGPLGTIPSNHLVFLPKETKTWRDCCLSELSGLIGVQLGESKCPYGEVGLFIQAPHHHRALPQQLPFLSGDKPKYFLYNARSA